MSIAELKDTTGRIRELPLNLQPNEDEALASCRSLVAADEDLKNFRDATLARFLRHQSWQVEPAIKQMKEYVTWRKENNIDHILDKDDFPSKALIRRCIPYAYHKADKEGRPLYIEKTGMIATAALADESTLPFDDVLHSHIYGVEMLLRRMHENSLERGERVNGITTILDLNGLGFHHRSCLSVLKRCLDFDSKYYPEYLGKLYVINTPWVGTYLYQAVQVFLDEVTKSRIQIISGDPKEFLLSQIASENLPREYGGTCDGQCNAGGLGVGYLGLKGCCDVLDQSTLKLPANAPDGLERQEISYDFERVVSSKEEGDTITWYFHVENDYDIDFSVQMLPASGQPEKDENKKVYVQKVQRLKNGRGSFKAPMANVKLLLRWDNNFSYFASKVIHYTVEVIQDKTFVDAAAKAGIMPTNNSSSGSSSSSSQ